MSRLRLVKSLLLVCLSACSLHRQDSSAFLDKLRGRGPVLIDPVNELEPSTGFFHDTWRSSASIQHLVTQRGTPEAISVEREFLRPTRMKLFYPTQGQVYILDHLEGEWLVAGSEPLASADMDTLIRQRAKVTAPIVETVPVVHRPAPPAWQQPVAGVSTEEFRGRLKTPTLAAVAKLSRRADSSYIHTVSFPGEDFLVLADWYTDDSSNAARLAVLNKRRTMQALRVGDEIVIPRVLMVNPNPLPEAMVP